MVAENETQYESCHFCRYWITSESLMRMYGEGSGRCRFFKDIRFCTRKACLAFKPNVERVLIHEKKITSREGNYGD